MCYALASGRQEVIEQAKQQADRARDVAYSSPGCRAYDGPLIAIGRAMGCARCGSTWKNTISAISRGPNATNCGQKSE